MKTTSSQRTNLPATVGLLLIAALLLFVGYRLFRVVRFSWVAYHNGMALLDIANTDRTPQALAQSQPELAKLANALTGLEREIVPLAPLFHRLDGVTRYGSTVAVLPNLLTVGAEMAALGNQGLLLVAPALTASDESALAEDVAAAIASGDEAVFAQMGQRARRANAALLSIDADTLLPQLSAPVALAQELLPLLEPGLRLGPSIPHLLGMNRPMTYLVLAQNNQELRGAGGWITGVGVLKVERGQITSLDFSDSYALDNPAVDHPPAPAGMQRYMDIQLLFLRDANWSPDLPTAARAAHNLYRQDWGVEVDGIVTIDLRAVELIIAGIGSLQMEGVKEPVTSENVLDVMSQLWSNPFTDTKDESSARWLHQRKNFMPDLANAVLDTIKAGRFDYLALLQSGHTALNERAVQIWLQDPRAQEQLAALRWDGALHPLARADYLALVDSNVGYNKVNAVVARSMQYSVAWPDGADASALATTQVTYHHPVESPDHVCDQTSRYGDSRDDLMKRCYFNYVRLYVPRGSQLLSIDGVEADSVGSQRGIRSTQVLSGYFEMKPGTTHTVTFTYRLPPLIRQDEYRLVIQRQSGSGPLPVQWDVAGQTFSATISENLLDWSRFPQLSADG